MGQVCSRRSAPMSSTTPEADLAEAERRGMLRGGMLRWREGEVSSADDGIRFIERRQMMRQGYNTAEVERQALNAAAEDEWQIVPDERIQQVIQAQKYLEEASTSKKQKEKIKSYEAPLRNPFCN